MKAIRLEKEFYTLLATSEFKFIFNTEDTEINSQSKINIRFPKYYSPHLGNDIECTINDNTDLLNLFCEVIRDNVLEIWGPRSQVFAADTEITLVIVGIISNKIPDTSMI